jgi:hypothetical protein
MILNSILFLLELMTINSPGQVQHPYQQQGSNEGILSPQNSKNYSEHSYSWVTGTKIYNQSKLNLYIIATRTSALLAALLGCIQKFPHWVGKKIYACFCYWTLLSPSKFVQQVQQFGTAGSDFWNHMQDRQKL